MPIHLKAMVVIIVLAAIVFVFARSGAIASAIRPSDFDRRRNLWLAITLGAFLAHNYWIFAVFAAAILFAYARRDESNKFAMFLFLLFAVPMYEAEIGGLGIAKQLFTLDYVRLLSLVLLFPAFLEIRSQPGAVPLGRLVCDKFLLGYLFLNFSLLLSANTFTNTLRQGVLYGFLDVFLPYYVASRSIRDLQAFRDVIASLVVASLILSAIAAFEFARHWLLYVNLDEALGTKSFGGYLVRGEGILRAQASTGQPIVLGYVATVAGGLFIFLRAGMPRMSWIAWMAVLLVGAVAPVSRGPWVGAAVMLLFMIATGPSPVKRIVKLGVFGTIAFSVLLATPVGESMVSYLPFVGTVDTENVTFRQSLVSMAIQVLEQNPFFGAYDYVNAAEFEELKQGNGFLDIVNSYVAIALGSGLVGLTVFLGVFLGAGYSIFRGMLIVGDRSNEKYLLGQVLLATLIGILVMIFTVSSISYIPVIYWSLAGLGMAYISMVNLGKAPVAATGKRPTELSGTDAKCAPV